MGLPRGGVWEWNGDPCALRSGGGYESRQRFGWSNGSRDQSACGAPIDGRRPRCWSVCGTAPRRPAERPRPWNCRHSSRFRNHPWSSRGSHRRRAPNEISSTPAAPCATNNYHTPPVFVAKGRRLSIRTSYRLEDNKIRIWPQGGK